MHSSVSDLRLEMEKKRRTNAFGQTNRKYYCLYALWNRVELPVAGWALPIKFRTQIVQKYTRTGAGYEYRFFIHLIVVDDDRQNKISRVATAATAAAAFSRSRTKESTNKYSTVQIQTMGEYV